MSIVLLQTETHGRVLNQLYMFQVDGLAGVMNENFILQRTDCSCIEMSKVLVFVFICTSQSHF